MASSMSDTEFKDSCNNPWFCKRVTAGCGYGAMQCHALKVQRRQSKLFIR